MGHKLKRKSGYIRLRNRKIGSIFVKPEFPTTYKLVAKFLVRRAHFKVFKLSKLIHIKTKPLIKSFKAKPSVVTPSSSTRYPAKTRIKCDIRGATEAKLICAGSTYKIDPWGGIVRVPIYNKTKCVLKARNTYFETEKSIEIQIKPKITYFKISPELIRSGGKARLAWSFIGAEKAIIEPGIGNILDKRSVYVSPSETAVYKLIISSEQGKDEKTVKVRVSPVISYFKVDKSAIYPGESVNLSWEVKSGVEKVSVIRKNENKNRVLIHEDNKAIGNFKDTPPNTGSLKFFYRLEIKNDAGMDVSRYLIVSFIPKILYFKADRYEIKYGEEVKLYWKALGAYTNRTMLRTYKGAFLLVDGSPVEEKGFVVKPKETTTYILTVRGPKGSAKETIVVKVRK